MRWKERGAYRSHPPLADLAKNVTKRLIVKSVLSWNMDYLAVFSVARESLHVDPEALMLDLEVLRSGIDPCGSVGGSDHNN